MATLEAASEKDLKKQITRAEREFRRLDALDTVEVARTGKADETLAAMARAAAAADDAKSEREAGVSACADGTVP
jgi:hypothetical protein